MPSGPNIRTLSGSRAYAAGSPSSTASALRFAMSRRFILHGETIPEITEALGLTQAQVFHALSYYFDHCDEITAMMAEEEQAHAEFSGL